jgi:TATA-box binding protein (TBP) (component of TFIID and TFIIIB)
MMQQIFSHHQLLFSSGKSLCACAKKQHQMMQQIFSPHHQLLFSSGKSLCACAKTLNDAADNLSSSPAALQLR